MMRENAEEDFDDAKLPAAQRRPVGVTEIRAFDQLAAQHAAGRHIAFNDVHAKLPTGLVARWSNIRAENSSIQLPCRPFPPRGDNSPVETLRWRHFLSTAKPSLQFPSVERQLR